MSQTQQTADLKQGTIFEGFDLCKIVQNEGLKLFITSESKVLYCCGECTKHLKNRRKIFAKSCLLYVKKIFGLPSALFVKTVLLLNKEHIPLLLIVILAFFLRINLLPQTMSFIGDQGWFYLSARDMLLSGKIPMVGISSSHPWLHQGALWTYILGILFYFFNFHPIVPGYFTAFVGVVSTALIFYISQKMFSKDVGLISALLYATSPFVVMNDRMPYHTTLIPFFTLLFLFFMYKLVKGNPWVFSLIIGMIAVLYNFEIATFTLVFVLLTVLGFGFLKNELFVKKLKDKGIFFWSCVAFIIPMTPMLLYDMGHGFPQTVKFIGWMGYKVLQIFGLFEKQGTNYTFFEIIQFLLSAMQKILFAYNAHIALSLFILGLLIAFNNIKEWNYRIIVLSYIIPLLGLIISKAPSDAYIPVLFPTMIIATSLALNSILSIQGGRILLIVLLLIISGSNSYYLLQKRFSLYEKTHVPITFKDRKESVMSIIRQSDKTPYNLYGKGSGCEFESFIMNYEYIAWWLGEGPSKNRENLFFTIEETSNGIIVQKHFDKL